jgi:hypothetical protein
MAKIVSKKGKTFADVAKPIQNLIEKLKDRPKSQANDNTIMLLEKQLDDLFAKQEAIKEAQNPQPQQMQMPQQMPMQQPMGQENMMGQPQQMPSPEEQQEMMQGQPQMGYGGYLPKYAGDEPPYTGVVGTAYRDPNIDNYYTPLPPTVNNQVPDNQIRIGQKVMGTPNFLPVRQMVPNGPLPNVTKASNTPIGVYSPTYTAAPFITKPGQTSTKTTSAATPQSKNKKQPFDRWGEVGAMTTGAAALAKELSNINAVKRPGILQNVYLSPGAAPDKVDYSAEQEALNTDIAAAREANKLAGGNPAVLGQLRAEQLRRRGQISQGQENANTELMNQYKRERTEAMQKSQAANAEIAKENMYNDYGYNQWLAGQKNAVIGAGANALGTVFNNQTMYKNQLDAAQIMANAHPKSVWTDTSGNKYVTLENGTAVPVKAAFGGVIKNKKPGKVNMDNFKAAIKKR